jgi:LytS/YehU family sensor histidine kinase
MQERFAGRVTLILNIADDVLDAAVPAMLLQPLLENAFKHGVERSREPVIIRLEAQRAGETLHLTIHNTGSTLPATPAMGIGIRNCRERLALMFGQHASLELEQDETGVAARLRLPYQPHVE